MTVHMVEPPLTNLSLQPYPDYAPCGIPWLPEAPAHWKTRRAKLLFEKLSREIGAEDEVVTCFRDGVVTLRKNRRLTGFTESLKEIGYQGVRVGDLVIHAMDAFAGAVGVSDSDGKSSPVYVVCKPRDDDENPHYYAYVIREMARSQWIVALAKGIRERSTDFRFEEFARQFLPVPPRDEQDAMVLFLAHYQGIIQRLIKCKRKLIELLNEQRQSIIQQIVTEGLDPNVPRKPSGLAYLKEIPAHWDNRPAKYSFREVDERSTTGDEELLSVSHITGVTPRSHKRITMFMAQSYVGHKLCRQGDLVINTMWAWMAALGVSRYTGIVSSSYNVYRPIRAEKMVPAFVDFLLRTKPYVSEYITLSTGIQSSRLRLYPDKFLKLPLLLPPRDEQQRIVEAIMRQTSQLDSLIERARKEIELLQEYRIRLTTDVITGKLDVRQSALTLPTLDLTELEDQVDPSEDEEDQDVDAIDLEQRHE